MKHCFFIGCYIPDKNYQGKNDIIECVSNIRNFHPKSDICVIDSDSSYLEHYDNLKKFNVKIDLAKNKHRSTGMIWHAYNNYPEYDYYYFLHDGHSVKDNLESSMKHDVVTISYFNSHKGLGRSNPKREYGFSPNGKYPRESLEWCESMLNKHTQYTLPEIFTGVTYSVFFCKRNVLDKLHQKGLSNILPTNKTQDQSMERVWGIALESEGYDLKSNSYRNTNKIIKKIRGRK
jgi:hypothetical protein